MCEITVMPVSLIREVNQVNKECKPLSTALGVCIAQEVGGSEDQSQPQDWCKGLTLP